MDNDKIFEALMSLKEDVSSIKTDIKNIKEQNKEIKEQNKRLDQLENTVAQHSSHFKALWTIVVGVTAFIFLYIVAPLAVNFLSR